MFSRPDNVILLLLAGLVLYYAWLYQNFAQDDAFITYRYARNIANGHGFVYNRAEPVLGTTTPLYTLTLALVAKLSRQDIRLISHVISALSLWGGGLLLYRLGKDQGRLRAAAVAFVFVTNPLLMSAIGMETFFLLLILLLALNRYLSNQFKLAAILLGLAIITRYETAVFAMILGLDFMLKHKKLPFWLIPAAIIVSAWLAFGWYTFGDLIPNSARIKLAESEGYSFALGALIWWSVYLRQTAWYYTPALLALLGLYAVVSRRELGRGYLILLIWTGLYFALASFAAGSFSWYYGPLIPGCAILVSWGTAFLAHYVGNVIVQFQGKLSIWPTSPVTPLFIVLVLGLVGLQYVSATTGWVTHQGQIIDAREPLYREVAGWLNRNGHQGQTVAIGEIGILGYYTDMRIVDLRGLVTPDLRSALLQGRVTTLNQVMKSYRPDYLLTDEPPLIETMSAFPDYRPVQTFKNDAYILYQRQNQQGGTNY